ncbi:MAG: hypothetical protein PHV34_24025, partial [Verrucomicrobiae bacterium]|nr:hypothetical protein [Verrucomicrobiae bacterium]MDD2711058.1 hypothetical protein [Verrucomicrobiae bacterium]
MKIHEVFFSICSRVSRWGGKLLGAGLVLLALFGFQRLQSQDNGDRVFQGLNHAVWLRADGTVWSCGSG